jgi:hypothetical protein
MSTVGELLLISLMADRYHFLSNAFRFIINLRYETKRYMSSKVDRETLKVPLAAHVPIANLRNFQRSVKITYSQLRRIGSRFQGIITACKDPEKS